MSHQTALAATEDRRRCTCKSHQSLHSLVSPAGCSPASTPDGGSASSTSCDDYQLLQDHCCEGREPRAHPSAEPNPSRPESNAQDLWIGSGRMHEGRTFPNDPVMVTE